jgi:hypothetical protein
MAVGCRPSVRLTAEAGAEEGKVLFVAEGSLKVRLVVGAVYDCGDIPGRCDIPCHELRHQLGPSSGFVPIRNGGTTPSYTPAQTE